MRKPDLKHTEIEIVDTIATLWLNQPDIRNAMNPPLLTEVIQGFRWLEENNDVKVILIRGKGKSYCAGADIRWLEQSAMQSYEKNYSESELLAECFTTIYEMDKVVISLVHGHAFGGALGLMAAGDFSFAVKETLLGLPELKLGVFSAVITPFLLTRISLSDLKYKIYTAETFSADEARNIGIVDKVFNTIGEMESYTGELVQKITVNSQTALSAGKELFRELNKHLMLPENISKCAKTLTDLKISEEARSRMLTFINKK